MVLAAFGTPIAESSIEAEAHTEEHGIPIEELERLAGQHGLEVAIQETTVEDLRRILGQGGLPIANLDRAVFDLNPRQRARHSQIPPRSPGVATPGESHAVYVTALQGEESLSMPAMCSHLTSRVAFSSIVTEMPGFTKTRAKDQDPEYNSGEPPFV
jgi:hypothetical protein